MNTEKLNNCPICGDHVAIANNRISCLCGLRFEVAGASNKLTRTLWNLFIAPPPMFCGTSKEDN